MSNLPPLAITFDFGQTLASFDTVLASARLAERGLQVEPERLESALPFAWQTYNDAIRQGFGGHPWKILMRSLLECANASINAKDIEQAVDFLWDQQPIKNLWRRPIPGMIELVDDIIAAHVQVAIVSNSEEHWDTVWRAYLNSKVPAEKTTFLGALASTADRDRLIG